MPITTSMPAMLPTGIHVAPFMDPSGRPMLLAVGPGGRLAALATVATMEGERWIRVPAKPGEAQKYSPSVQVCDSRLFLTDGLEDGLYAELQHPTAPIGLSVAPWRPQLLPEGVVYIGITQEGRLLFLREASVDEPVEPIAREFERILHEEVYADAGDEAWADWEKHRPGEVQTVGDLVEDLETLRRVGAPAEFVKSMEVELAHAQYKEQARARTQGAGR